MKQHKQQSPATLNTMDEVGGPDRDLASAGRGPSVRDGTAQPPQLAATRRADGNPLNPRVAQAQDGLTQEQRWRRLGDDVDALASQAESSGKEGMRRSAQERDQGGRDPSRKLD